MIRMIKSENELLYKLNNELNNKISSLEFKCTQLEERNKCLQNDSDKKFEEMENKLKQTQ